MPFSFELPSEYGYVLAVASSSLFVNFYHIFTVGAARKAAGIQYPNAYASDEVALKDPKAFTFNCAQRAHANFTENLTPFLAALLISGLRFPLVAAGLGGVWVLARILFATGYVSAAGPKGRHRSGGAHFMTGILLALLSAYSSALFVLDK